MILLYENNVSMKRTDLKREHINFQIVKVLEVNF